MSKVPQKWQHSLVSSRPAPPTHAEQIATTTGKPLADVEAILAADAALKGEGK